MRDQVSSCLVDQAESREGLKTGTQSRLQNVLDLGDIFLVVSVWQEVYACAHTHAHTHTCITGALK